jgi:hypothetical protein
MNELSRSLHRASTLPITVPQTACEGDQCPVTDEHTERHAVADEVGS